MQKLRQPEPLSTTPRYDTETVREVLARATQIEAQETPERLSAEQVETLGAELGIAPDAVRRALGELETGQRSQSGTPLRNRRLTQAQIYAIPTPGIIYFSLLSALFFLLEKFSSTGQHHVTLIFLVFFLPSFASAWMGWQRKDGRLSAPSAFLLSALALLAPVVGIGLASHRWDGYGSEVTIYLWLAVSVSVLMAFTGGWVREGYDSDPHKNDR